MWIIWRVLGAVENYVKTIVALTSIDIVFFFVN